MKLFILVCLLLAPALFSQSLPDKYLDSLVKAGIVHLTNQDYFRAELVFEKIRSTYPDNPLGNLYLAAGTILESSDYGLPLEEKKIEDLLDAAMKKANALLSDDSESLWNNYYVALVKGFEAYYNGLNGSMLSALSSGLKAVSYFEKCIAIDPDFSDAYIALGTYKYWKSDKTDFLNWLPFVTDERQTGIDYLRKGIYGNSKNALLGFNSLVWIYIRQKNFREALKIANDAIIRFPSSRMIKMSLARVHENSDFAKAISLYREVLASFEKENKLTNYRRVILLHKIAQNYQRLGDNKKALALCNEILAIKNFSAYESQKLQGRLKRVNELRDELK
ncbi:MAG: tetratricopeptide repeat protein [Ignavibacteriaceae bacterium]|jgi:tetratricopeptide (TPR) repeat protein|nr:tetratricopeptide repeat protein [Ignavibacteriaceae bacterium]